MGPQSFRVSRSPENNGGSGPVHAEGRALLRSQNTGCAEGARWWPVVLRRTEAQLLVCTPPALSQCCLFRRYCLRSSDFARGDFVRSLYPHARYTSRARSGVTVACPSGRASRREQMYSPISRGCVPTSTPFPGAPLPFTQAPEKVLRAAVLPRRLLFCTSPRVAATPARSVLRVKAGQPDATGPPDARQLLPAARSLSRTRVVPVVPEHARRAAHRPAERAHAPSRRYRGRREIRADPGAVDKSVCGSINCSIPMFEPSALIGRAQSGASSRMRPSTDSAYRSFLAPSSNPSTGEMALNAYTGAIQLYKPSPSVFPGRRSEIICNLARKSIRSSFPIAEKGAWSLTRPRRRVHRRMPAAKTLRESKPTRCFS
jgi:hypothetical protein